MDASGWLLTWYKADEEDEVEGVKCIATHLKLLRRRFQDKHQFVKASIGPFVDG